MRQDNVINSILVFRLSSLGDVLLARSFLDTLPDLARVDWVVAAEFAFALEGHPKISKLIKFNKKSGLIGWVKLVISLARSQNPYSVRVDLHRTLRTRLAFVLFYLYDGILKRKFTPSLTVSKERFRTWGLLIFKNKWPQSLLPTPYWKRFAGLAVTAPFDRGPLKPPVYTLKTSQMTAAVKHKSVCIMPASKWNTKEWSVDSYELLIKKLIQQNRICYLLGRSTDLACKQLTERLHGMPGFMPVLDETQFEKTAEVISNCFVFIGGDTGLAHLAEAVGTPAIILYGPTRPALGFGPHLKESVSVVADVGCSPCSKDGRTCYRFFDPYACLKRISVDTVLQLVEQKKIVEKKQMQDQF
jgi:ADP-heptose:LPS heptosyltransferase